MDLEEDIIGVISCPGPLKYCFDRFRLRTDDATGWVYNNFGANIGIVSNIFFSTAIIFFARSQLGCAEPGDVCGRVHGLRPSSLVTVVVTFSGVITAFFMPYIGAIVDYTPKRAYYSSSYSQLRLAYRNKPGLPWQFSKPSMDSFIRSTSCA